MDAGVGSCPSRSRIVGVPWRGHCKATLGRSRSASLASLPLVRPYAAGPYVSISLASVSENCISLRVVDGRHRRLEAKAARERAVQVSHPRV